MVFIISKFCSFVSSSRSVGPINTLIYPVEGGMEDWLYAAGWDKGPLRSCIGDTTPNKRTLAQGRRLFTPAPSDAANDPAAGSRIDGGQHNSTVEDTTSSAPQRQLNQHEHIGENRAVVFLVETSDRKKPADSTLGGTLNVSEGSYVGAFLKSE
jgi:hypothetical protein